MTTKTGKPSRLTNLAKLALYGWDLEIIDVLARLAHRFRKIKVIDFNSREKIKQLSFKINFADFEHIAGQLLKDGFKKSAIKVGIMNFNKSFNEKFYMISLHSADFHESKNNFITIKNLLTG